MSVLCMKDGFKFGYVFIFYVWEYFIVVQFLVCDELWEYVLWKVIGSVISYTLYIMVKYFDILMNEFYFYVE